MPDFNTIEGLWLYVQMNIDEGLEKSIAPKVKEAIQDSVRENVYAVYEPSVYDRREFDYGSEGLGDISQMHHFVKNGVLEVTDDAFPQEQLELVPLATRIEEGYWDRSKPWNKPRPFLRLTIEKFKETQKIKNALRSWLKIKGIETTG